MFIPLSMTVALQHDLSTGKHSDGKCQKDFSCKNTSHDKYPNKRHVLVCHEHRENTENEQFLLEHKNRCIMKQNKLAAFSGDLKLTFYMNNNNQVIINIHNQIKNQKSTYSILSK